MRWILLIPVTIAFALVALSSPADAGIGFTVSKTFDTDDGVCDADCSLREAINAANGTPGLQPIRFEIPGPGVQTLLLQLGPLPEITDPVFFDGTSQADASCASWPVTIRIEIDGSSLPGFPNGLDFVDGSSGSRVLGLSIIGFENFGISLSAETEDILVNCSHLGVQADGITAAGNGIGIFADGSGHGIGGELTGSGNVISGNVGDGVNLFGDDIFVQGNYIGVDALGGTSLGNNFGLNVSGTNNLIGGLDPSVGNLISANRASGIVVAGADETRILGNTIGTDLTGTSLTLGNDAWGILVSEQAGAVQIGSIVEGSGNLVSGNDDGAVVATNGDAGFNSQATTIENNLFGTQADGETSLGGGSVLLQGEGHVVGGDDPATRNVIQGLRIEGSFNLVNGNHICWSASGLVPLDECQAGVTISEGSNNLIGNTTGNLIRGVDDAVRVFDAGPSILIANNVIGLDAAGQPAPNGPGSGILVQRFDGSQAPNLGVIRNNVVSNANIGIEVVESQVSVEGNRIGTDAAGLVAIPNAFGIFYQRSIISIGGEGPGDGNLISGNSDSAIVGVNPNLGGLDNIEPSAEIVGNLIGTDITGLAALPNGQGIVIPQPGVTVIGGETPASGNVISGNLGDAISITDDCAVAFPESSLGHTITQNLIGVGSDGVTLLGNGGIGIALEACLPAGELRDVFIGQQQPGQQGLGNVIAGNLIGIRTRNVTFTRIVGNAVGTDRSGALELGNLGDGLRLDSSSALVVGQDFFGEGEGNIIRFNGGQGVIVTGTPFTGTAVVGNSISDNEGLGIDLLEPSTGDGVVTPNDVGDLDTTGGGDGPHDLQNFPVIESAVTQGGETHVVGLLSTLPNRTYFAEIFSSSTCDPSGHGEAETSLGLLILSTDDNGEAPIDEIFPVGLQDSEFITAVAIDSLNQTSEISACVPVNQPLTVEIPTLGTWGIALLSALLGLSAITLMRRQRS